MIRDITLGQYYPAESVLHKLDPRVKITGTFLYLLSLFLFRDVIGYVIAFIFLIAMIIKSRVPFKFMVKGLKGILVILIFTAVINIFLTPGEILYSVWKFNITREGLRVAVRMIIRLIFLVLGTSLMTLTILPPSSQ